MTDIKSMADKVNERAKVLLPQQTRPEIDKDYIKQCLDANERGDGTLFASLHKGNYLYNTTPKEGEWYKWAGHVWQVDDYRSSLAAVEDAALEYQALGDALQQEIRDQEIDKDHAEAWKLELHKKYKARVDRLRSAAGAIKVLFWAPIVQPKMACREEDFDKDPYLLPVLNGVIDLRTSVLTDGRPADLLTRTIDLEYDPHADYTPWQEFVDYICDDKEVSAFIKRIFGYAVTGNSYEQFIFLFTGPGRNGKGVLFDLIGDVMRSYYHVISRAMILEQRNEPSPSAASEHKYSLLGKRIIVGAETNKNQRIDAGAVKSLTGDDDINCRPNFKSEVTFKPSHTLFLHTNHVPVGLTRDFALVQRLIKIEFPFMFVDDPVAEGKKKPSMADRFRKKDTTLKETLRKCKPGILTWLVEGAKEWKEQGLRPPQAILDSVSKLAEEEDYIGQFVLCCLERHESSEVRVRCTEMYDAFRWWWAQNMDESEKRIPAMKTINQDIRSRGIVVDKSGGKTWIFNHAIAPEIEDEVREFMQKKG